MILKNLKGVLSGEGFLRKQGRRPEAEDIGLRAGPIDIHVDDAGIIRAVRASEPGVEGDFDASGLVASAGFVDSHTHALFAGSRAHEYFLRWRGASYKEVSDAGGGIHNTFRDTAGSSEESLVASLLERAAGARSFGTTTLEVKTGYADTAAGELRLLRILKEARSRPAHSLPDIRATFLGLHSLPKGRDEKDFVDEMISLLPTIADEKLADCVDAFPEKGFFTLEESLRFAKAASEHGLSLKIHADELTPLGSAEAFSAESALSVDHLQKISDAGVRALASSSTVASLLPCTSLYLGLAYVDARRLLDAGARVALATDFNPGTAPWPDFRLTNLLAASQLKMSPAEILCASTCNGAAAMGLSDRGALVPGQRADLLLWKIDGDLKHAAEEILLSPKAPVRVFAGGR